MKDRIVRYPKIAVTLIALALFGTWYFSHVPSNDRAWSPDQQILPYAEFRDDEVEVFNIRNFTYDSVDEYTPAYYDKTFNINDLTSVDYIVEPFGNLGAAHTFLSFGFENGDHLAISIEIRKEVGESFSPWRGLLRQYELMYVVADERDAIGLRALHRKHDAYLYPVQVSEEHARQLFTDMLERANELKEKPEFYNTLTNTCTTNIARHINNISGKRVPWDIRLLLPANSDVLAYELGLLDQSIPLSELRARHHINAKAEQYADDLDFSRLIRQ